MSQICCMLNNPVITWKLSHKQNSPAISRSHCWGRGGIWRRKWEHLKAWESNGKLPLRTCLECSVPEPYRSPDWVPVPAKPTQGLNTINNNNNLQDHTTGLFLSQMNLVHFFTIHTFQSANEVHPASFSRCTEGSFCGTKVAGV
jgi:hypothetical protein